MWRRFMFLSILSPTNLYVYVLEGIDERFSGPRKALISTEESETDESAPSLSEDMLEIELGVGAEISDDVSLPPSESTGSGISSSSSTTFAVGVSCAMPLLGTFD